MLDWPTQGVLVVMNMEYRNLLSSQNVLTDYMQDEFDNSISFCQNVKIISPRLVYIYSELDMWFANLQPMLSPV